MTPRDKSNGWLSGMTYRGDFYKWLQAKINWLCSMLWHDEKIDKVGQFVEKIEDSHFIKNDLKPDRIIFLKSPTKHAKEKTWIENMF
jgi:hypothetical protein